MLHLLSCPYPLVGGGREGKGKHSIGSLTSQTLKKKEDTTVYSISIYLNEELGSNYATRHSRIRKGFKTLLEKVKNYGSLHGSIELEDNIVPCVW